MKSLRLHFCEEECASMCRDLPTAKQVDIATLMGKGAYVGGGGSVFAVAGGAVLDGLGAVLHRACVLRDGGLPAGGPRL